MTRLWSCGTFLSPEGYGIRFGPFEADLHTRELRRHGLRGKLNSRRFPVLAMLLGRPGEVVTWDEIRTNLGPMTPLVDFDHELSS